MNKSASFHEASSYVTLAPMSWRSGQGITFAPEHTMKPRAAVKNPELEEKTDTATAVDIPWQVIVHNDPVNLMTYVTMVFQKVFGYPREKAERHMLEVHEKGRSILWSGMRERAELYVQQLHGYLLLATLERTI